MVELLVLSSAQQGCILIFWDNSIQQGSPNMNLKELSSFKYESLQRIISIACFPLLFQMYLLFCAPYSDIEICVL